MMSSILSPHLFCSLGSSELLYHAVSLHDLLVHQVDVGGQLAQRLLGLGDPLLVFSVGVVPMVEHVPS